MKIIMRIFILGIFVNPYLEIPLHSKCRIPEERLGALRVTIIHEIIRELPFSTYAEMLCEVIPQLWLGKDDQTTMIICLLTTPEVNETGKTQFVIAEIQAPHTRQLSTGI
jgi:hypothetical protein